ncbi:hypothetical protein MG290_00905 [Flavobacterium sp. CBA20B-1]|uniref:hypothetical protein n=1 Tax=unclassified Flavobacterium TaxID=196869 RepID=UPI0022253594|nr:MULTISPECIES: hypothetical protein [unclassified Flavobacterium]WCM42260.1 hypothetical protein MG290_00905 [Flavobacterium sp. CBA20B-1]
MELTDTFEIKNGNRHFNYFKCIQYLQQQARNLYGSSYTIHKSQMQPLYRLLAYASQNSEESKFYSIDTQKGLLIIGAQNSGKTSLMHLIKPFFQPQHQYIIRSSREVAAYCKLFGKNTIEKYRSYKTYYCFDDLGLEPILSYSDSKIEIVRELIEMRLIQSSNTHIITRMSPDKLQKRYGKDFCNLLFQSLNVIAFTQSFNF